MSGKQKDTAWIQNLKKQGIIEELEKRGETFKQTDTYKNLREHLRESIKKENQEHKTPENSELESESDKEDNMADQKFEFQQNDSWELFEEKLDCLFIAKNITDNKVKVATLVTKLGPEPHALLKQLIAPTKIIDSKYEDLTKALSEHLKPKPSEVMERCTFHTSKQESHESIMDFIARLKKLATHCNFTELDNAIRDQLVCGVSDKDIRIKLFEEKTLTLQKAQEIAIAREAAVKNATNSNITLENKSVRNEVHTIQGDEQRAWQRRGQRGRGMQSKADSDNNNKQQQPSRHSTESSRAKELARLVKLGHLIQVNESKWATPIVPVLKGTGEIRICGDFKLTLNQYLLIDKYPLHTIDEIFAKLQGVDDKSAVLLTIITHKGLFRYTRIPEGISSAPADIQRKMDECLSGIDGVIAYLDNIYVSGKTEEEHLENLKKVCQRLQDCNFMKQRIDVLGFEIDKDGLHKSKSKINAMIGKAKAALPFIK
ncbi:uncharacterized protein LOC116418285 [Nasonia vitripennis]|uniref:Reverse transcriptase domain-containing protein n=1 Tax=Nasonia vitripennis TaxID=7425 RepID=A0A7M7QQA2_NASVI|nr:uncharacterized protein LOC116418285 [Nasonia vitripennis]